MMNKTLITLALSSLLPMTASTSYAALPVDAQLIFEAGVKDCTVGGTFPNCDFGVSDVTSGSFFSMDQNGNGSVEPSEKTVIAPNENILLGFVQTASGSHGGPQDGTANPGIDAPWFFFSNTGMHKTSAPIVINNDDLSGTVELDFSGWKVTWNAIDSIDMGGGSQDCGTASDGICVDVAGNDIAGLFNNGNSTATITCAVDCAVGDTFTLSYATTVPQADPSNFGGVNYTLSLAGTVGVCSGDVVAPNAVNDNYDVATDTAGSFLILVNDADSGCAGLDKGSVDLDPAAGIQTTFLTAAGGTATVDTITGDVTYTPGAGYQGLDSFSYTVSDRSMNTSAATTVSIVVGDAPPTCNNDGLADGAFIDIVQNLLVNIDVLANDLNTTNTIVPSTVSVVNDVSNGMTSVQADGTVTYTPTVGFTGTDSFTYNVSDDAAAPLTCTDATVTITVSEAGDSIGGVTNAYLVLKSGNVTDINSEPALGEGSWFSMEVKPNENSYTPVVGFNHVQLGTTQIGLTGTPNIDSPWSFFGNLGVHQTTSDLIQLSNDGIGNAKLNMTGWDVSWNSIPTIPLGEGQDNGIGTLTCYTDLLANALGTCAAGDEFLLAYRAIVPPGDPSGFGGVNYVVHFEGTIAATAPQVGCGVETAPSDIADVSVIDDCATPSAGVVFGPGSTPGNTSGVGLTAAQIGSNDPLLNPNDGQMCVGGCLDFVVTGIATDHIDIVVKLNTPILEGGILRKFINGHWQNFDVSGADEVGSRAVDATTGNCQGPEGVYQIGLRTGNQCLYLKIYDGGPNDADGVVNGTVVDPSGVLLPGSPNLPASSTSGCSLSAKPVALRDRLDWMIVAAFIVLLGVRIRRRKV